MLEMAEHLRKKEAVRHRSPRTPVRSVPASRKNEACRCGVGQTQVRYQDLQKFEDHSVHHVHQRVQSVVPKVCSQSGVPPAFLTSKIPELTHSTSNELIPKAIVQIDHSPQMQTVAIADGRNFQIGVIYVGPEIGLPLFATLGGRGREEPLIHSICLEPPPIQTYMKANDQDRFTEVRARDITRAMDGQRPGSRAL